MAKREIVSKVANAVLYSDGLIRIDNVRASYPHLDRPWSKEEGQEKKYSIVAMLNKKTHAAAKDLCVKRINELMKEGRIEKLASDKKFIRDGDNSDKTDYEGHWTVSASESRRPSVRGKNNEVLSPEEIVDTVYAGCYVSVLIRPWLQDNKYGKRVNAGLVAVRFMKDGEPFDNGRISDDDLDDMYSDLDDGDDDSFGSDDDDL